MYNSYRQNYKTNKNKDLNNNLKLYAEKGGKEGIAKRIFASSLEGYEIRREDEDEGKNNISIFLYIFTAAFSRGFSK